MNMNTDQALDASGVTNEGIRAFVSEWATSPPQHESRLWG